MTQNTARNLNNCYNQTPAITLKRLPEAVLINANANDENLKLYTTRIMQQTII